MKSFIKDNKGSFTIEATLVFPFFLIFVLMLVFVCIIIFQFGTAHYVAQKAASQVAYTWNNSHKDLTTGELSKANYHGFNKGDGLYWRITDDGVLQIFGLNGFPGSSVMSNKIEKGESKYNGSIKVELEYHNSIIHSEVEAIATSTLYLPSFMVDIFGNEVKAGSTRVVSDSPELIRTFNFTKYMVNEFGLNKKVQSAIDSIKGFFGGG